MSTAKHRYEFYSGLFLVVGILVFSISIWLLGAERQIFATQERYQTSFADVGGLNVGAPVRLGGITIGRVANISFAPALSDNRIYVAILINAEYVERMRADSVVSIETQGLLGDKFLSVSSGRATNPLMPGSSITSRESGDFGAVLAKADLVVQNTVEISESMRSFLGEFQGSGAKEIAEAFRNIATLTRDVEKGDGLLHALVYGKGGKETVENVRTTAKSIDQFASELSQLIVEVKKGNGFAKTLLLGSADPKNAAKNESMLQDLEATVKNLRKTSEALSQGSGTIGALMLDSTVYDNLVEVTDGAKRSFLLRQAVRSARGAAVKEEGEKTGKEE